MAATAAARADVGAFRGGGEQVTVEMNGLDGARTKVPLTTEDLTVDLQKVLEADVFREWVASIDGDEKLFVTAIEVQSVDMFGPRIGFIKFKSRALVNIGGDEGVVEVPGIVFMRGGAVGVLVILECEGEEHTILTYQARVPIGESALPEIPAGMLDGSGNFKGVAADEIAEECDLIISEEELVDLTELAYAGKWKGMLPSAGGCDEFIRLYMFRREVERDVLTELEGRLTGLREEGERIKLHIVPLKDCWKMTPDGKALSCLTLYEKLAASGKLPGVIRTFPSSVHELQHTDSSGRDAHLKAVGRTQSVDGLHAMARSTRSTDGGEAEPDDGQSDCASAGSTPSSASDLVRSKSGSDTSSQQRSETLSFTDSQHSRSSPPSASSGGSDLSRTSSAASRRHAGRSAGSKIKKGSGTKTRYKKIEREIEEKALQINSLEARVAELEAENARLRGEELPAKPKPQPAANLPLVEAGRRVSSIDEGAAEGQEEDDEASGPAGVANGSGGPHEAVPPAADETAAA